MQRSHKIQLVPNKKAVIYFKQACGIARLTYNVGLSQWKNDYKNGKKPNGMSLKKWFNSIKREQYPFVCDVTKCATERAFANLQNAFTRFFKKISDYPKYKKKYKSRDSFYLSNDKFSIKGKYVNVPRLGTVKMTEKLRYDGKILGAVISRRADKWYISIQVKVEPIILTDLQKPSVGIDFGIAKYAYLSDGKYKDNPRIFKRFEAKLRRLNKSLSRKTKFSNNWKKTKDKVARLHKRIADCRLDFIHKFTNFITKNYGIVCIEDLNVSGMLRNHKIAKHLQDVSLYETRRQLEYKCSVVRYCDRFDPTSKTCSHCGWKDIDLSLKDRIFTCKNCGFTLDRDFNASKNILRWATPKVKACGQNSSGLKHKVSSETVLNEAGIKLA